MRRDLRAHHGKGPREKRELIACCPALAYKYDIEGQVFLKRTNGKTLNGKYLFRAGAVLRHIAPFLKSSCPEVLFEFSTDSVMIPAYAEPLLLPATCEESRHAPSRSFGK